MSLLPFLFACATTGAFVPQSTHHTGARFEQPLITPNAIAVEAGDRSCRDLSDGLAYVLESHAQQHIDDDAPLKISLVNCSVRLDEKINLDEAETIETGDTNLDAILTGVGEATVVITMEGTTLDLFTMDTVYVERQDWKLGETHLWQEDVLASVLWSLSEKLEAKVVQHDALRPTLEQLGLPSLTINH